MYESCLHVSQVITNWNNEKEWLDNHYQNDLSINNYYHFRIKLMFYVEMPSFFQNSLPSVARKDDQY